MQIVIEIDDSYEDIWNESLTRRPNWAQSYVQNKLKDFEQKFWEEDAKKDYEKKNPKPRDRRLDR